MLLALVRLRRLLPFITTAHLHCALHTAIFPSLLPNRMSDIVDDMDMHEELLAPPPSHDEPIVYTPRGNSPSTLAHRKLEAVEGEATPLSRGNMLLGPATGQDRTPSPHPKTLPLTTQDVSSWWGGSDPVRHWKDQSAPVEKRSLPPEQEDRWRRTKLVSNASVTFIMMDGLREVSSRIADANAVLRLARQSRLAINNRLYTRCNS